MKTFLFIFFLSISYTCFSQTEEQKYIDISTNMIQFHDSSYIKYKFKPTESFNNIYFQIPNSLVEDGVDVALRCVAKKDSLNGKATWVSYIKKEFNSRIPFYLSAENDDAMVNGFIKVILKTKFKDYTMFIKLEEIKN